MKVHELKIKLSIFIKGLGKENEEDINNAVFIAKNSLLFDIPLDFRDGGRLGIQSYSLYALLGELSKWIHDIDGKSFETGKLLSEFSSEELRLMASYLWNEWESSLYKEEREDKITRFDGGEKNGWITS